MTLPRDFIPVNLRHVDARYGRSVIREIKQSEAARGVKTQRGRYTWAGPAAESALVNAYNRAKHTQRAELSDGDLTYDLLMGTPHGSKRCEVKTRIAEKGWIHPEKFDWISVPTHEGREPIKPTADLIFFCWWSAERPRLLWVVGMLRGVEQFVERSVFYKKGELLPRGGYVQEFGVYQIDVAQLDPVPLGLFKEVKGVFDA